MKAAASQDEVNRFLDQLRESGAINMFGAYPHVTEAFGLRKATAREMTAEWMRTFSERHEQHEAAAQ